MLLKSQFALLLGAALTVAALPAAAKGPAPTCSGAPTVVSADFTAGPPMALAMTWTAATCSVPISKYAIELTFTAFDAANGGTVDDCDAATPAVPLVEMTYSFTSPGAGLGYIFDPGYPANACGLGSVKLKALTTTRGGSNRSQNNPFSAPFEVVDATVPPV